MSCTVSWDPIHAGDQMFLARLVSRGWGGVREGKKKQLVKHRKAAELLQVRGSQGWRNHTDKQMGFLEIPVVSFLQGDTAPLPKPLSHTPATRPCAQDCNTLTCHPATWEQARRLEGAVVFSKERSRPQVYASRMTGERAGFPSKYSLP